MIQPNYMAQLIDAQRMGEEGAAAINLYSGIDPDTGADVHVIRDDVAMMVLWRGPARIDGGRVKAEIVLETLRRRRVVTMILGVHEQLGSPRYVDLIAEIGLS